MDRNIHAHAHTGQEDCYVTLSTWVSYHSGPAFDSWSRCPLYWMMSLVVESSWNVMAHGDVRKGKWRGNWRMEWVYSTLLTTLEHGVSSITTADAHNSTASSLLNWRPRRFKWTRPFRRKTESGFCACAITFQTQSNNKLLHMNTVTVYAWPLLYAQVVPYNSNTYKM